MRSELVGYLPYFLASLVISASTVPLFRSLSYRVGALDKGGGRRVHKGIIPRLGGGGIFFAFLIPSVYLIATRDTGKMPAIALSSLIVFALGVYDDIRGARVWVKLMAELLGALLLYHFGVRVNALADLGGFFAHDWLSLPETVLWILVVTNAVNLIDGLDGLAAGTGILVAITLLLVSGFGLSYNNIACVLLIGSLAGFLIYNFPPASVFMGDSGSLFTGFILASLSAASSAKASTMAALMVPILAFGVPLVDMLYAVLRRYYRGVPLGQADKEHIHHKLLGKGLSRKKVLVVLYSMNVFITLVCLAMVGRHKLLSMSALIALPLAVVFGLRIFGYIEFIPFAREMVKNLEKSRKGRYYNYLIKRFRLGASRAESLDSFRAEITELVNLKDIITLEIILDRNACLEGDKPFFLYAGGDSSKRAFTVTFPVFCENMSPALPKPRLSADPAGGLVRMTGSADGDFPIYCAEFVQAISEEVSAYYAKKPLNVPAYVQKSGGNVKPVSV